MVLMAVEQSEMDQWLGSGEIEVRRCPGCRTKILIREADTIVVKNAILRVTLRTGDASAKCPRCKGWVEVPLRYVAQ